MIQFRISTLTEPALFSVTCEQSAVGHGLLSKVAHEVHLDTGDIRLYELANNKQIVCELPLSEQGMRGGETHELRLILRLRGGCVSGDCFASDLTYNPQHGNGADNPCTVCENFGVAHAREDVGIYTLPRIPRPCCKLRSDVAREVVPSHVEFHWMLHGYAPFGKDLVNNKNLIVFPVSPNMSCYERPGPDDEANALLCTVSIVREKTKKRSPLAFVSEDIDIHCIVRPLLPLMPGSYCM